MRSLSRLAPLALGGVVLSLLVAGASPAGAGQCPSSAVGGKAIGWIEFDDVRVPIKPVNAPAGGELDPPATAKAAGVTRQHQPLLAGEGTTVIAWHVRYGPGCDGTLNPLLAKAKGSTFDIVTAAGKRQTYALTSRSTVPRGRYRPEWFRSNGDPQVALFTCADPRGGKYQKTTALFAVPVAGSAS
jgi:hypothetical protein